MTDPTARHPLTSTVFRDGLLDGQVALVTGGGSGIGFGIAQELTALGAHVVLASRKRERLDDAVARLTDGGGKASAAELDVRDPERVRAVVAEIAGEHGRLDILVNNAAGNFYAPSETLSPNAWKAVVEIDLYGTFYCSQAVLPVMRERGGGRIVNISMTLHYRGWPLMAHATAAKAGIDALTRTLALEWAPHGVRVNAVAPGPIPTEGVRKAFAPPPGTAVPDLGSIETAMAEHAARTIPLGRWGRPEDIGRMVAFLASPAGEWITGSIFVVDGGEWLARPGGVSA
ncbi:MAG TPA: SDR family oxidoreductase [Gemmatimonadaceae bacterium]|nr:SDR family oxidoreductase [Gemmatimonadaceae bacterium]